MGRRGAKPPRGARRSLLGPRAKQKRKLEEFASFELAELLVQNGPWLAGWSSDDLDRRSLMLLLLGHPDTLTVWGIDPASGQDVLLGDVANLLPGPVGGADPASVH